MGRNSPRPSLPPARHTNLFLERLQAHSRRPMVIAHRGDSAHAPENTLDAALKGWESGAEAWELDVQLTRDGAAVVLHDASLARTTNAARPRSDLARRLDVADVTLDELRALDAGSWFLAEPGGSRSAQAFGTRAALCPGEVARFGSGAVRIPLLRECLELTATLGWLVNVELKSYPGQVPGLLDVVAQEVAATGVAERVLVSSFDHELVAASARLGLRWATGVLVDRPLPRPGRYVRRDVGADCFHIAWEALRGATAGAGVTPRTPRADQLRSCAACSVPVLAYTVNDRPATAPACRPIWAGISGFFSDFPRRLVSLGENPPNLS